MLDKISERLYKIIEFIAGSMFALLFALNILRIGLRYLMGVAWIWIPDFSRFLFIWIVFLGASVLSGKNEHLLMDFFLVKMKEGARRKLELLIQIVQLSLFSVMLFGGARIAKVRMRIPFDTWDFPTGWAYLAVPVSAALMILFGINSITKKIADSRRNA